MIEMNENLSFEMGMKFAVSLFTGRTFEIYYSPEVRRGSIRGWKYSCCNTSPLSRYENFCIIIA